MSRSTTHKLQPQTDSSGLSRRLSVLACKRAIRSVLEKRLRADFKELELSESSAEVAPQVEKMSSYRFWASSNRAIQDRMWSVLAEQVDKDYSRIEHEALGLSKQAAGSLELSTGETAPAYLRHECIHGQPGGYLLERSAHDLAAGLLYEAGGNIYAMGQGIGKQDSKGERLIAHIRESYPGIEPKHILEMGCSAGGQSTDYPLAFPQAEFHAIDVAAAMLRFAHVRAEALGSAVHFHQADAADTGFADQSFDLIVSHNMFHEVAADHMPLIMQECYRLLAPGGVCIHQDVPIQTGRFDALGQFMSEWQKDHNNEPFWLDFANADLPAMLVEAGFRQDAVSSTYLQAQDGPIPWYVVAAVKG